MTTTKPPQHSGAGAPQPPPKGAAGDVTPFAGGGPGGGFAPPGDVPGAVPDPNFPSPTPYYNIYGFSVLLKTDLVNPSTGGPCNHLGREVRVSAPNKQAAYNAIVAQYGANLLNLRGPCCITVGADATLSAAAGG